ncbi:MAG: lytic transglycosylase domain-containing protein [Gammaproteobacteria bacterium]|nr:lytic transglycosylase domain-containing protein [Gammaproteobacteria bacterium]MBU2121137.1 lytic transglycosylase domain-containing protein [Gammaproteobacteria bacterium]MBU2170161.1 lytic transglycosylase domain-containing protein [Gammaproteobacteria bacterium]MBU2202722.1 lytic transglycosylase domain-containing protein [Gammaproteobacteria bacterium]MBU2276461.1 lytic transglycosylase domain-containing protein [Gammaproteobacteria bacterium]
MQQSARADLWAHVDERGVTHFASEQVDDRYQLFFRGNDFDSTRDVPADAPPMPYALPAAGARLLAFFDIAPGYKRVKHHLRAASTLHGVDYELLQAVIAAESGFDATAVSPKGAVGLMQVMPATASRFGVSSDAKRTVEQKLADPAVNVHTGARYLRHLLDLFPGRMDLAVAAYNAGEGAVQRAGNQIPAYKETQNYVRTVLGLYAQLKPPAPVLARRAAPGGRVRMELSGGALNRGNLPPERVAQARSASPNVNEEPVSNE